MAGTGKVTLVFAALLVLMIPVVWVFLPASFVTLTTLLVVAALILLIRALRQRRRPTG